MNDLNQKAKQATYNFLKLSGAWAGSESASKILAQIRKSRKRHKIQNWAKKDS